MHGRIEAVALERRAPVGVLVAEIARLYAECLLPARAEQFINLPAALGPLAVGEDPLLADLYAADATGEPRGAGDDVGHGCASDTIGRRKTALDSRVSIGAEPEGRARGTRPDAEGARAVTLSSTPLHTLW